MKTLYFFLVAWLLASPANAGGFYKPLQIPNVDFEAFSSAYLSGMYRSKSAANDHFEDLTKAFEAEFHEGDAQIPLMIAGRFSAGLGTSSGLESWQIDLAETIAEWLAEQGGNTELNASSQENIANALAVIALSNKTGNAEINQAALKGLIELAEETQGAGQQSAVVILSLLIGTEGERFKESDEEAADVLAKGLEADDLEHRRFVFAIVAKRLAQVTVKTTGVTELWEALNDSALSFPSPSAQARIKRQILNLTQSVKVPGVASLIRESKKVARQLEDGPKPTKKPFLELLEILAESDDVVDLEGALSAVLKMANTDPTLRQNLFAKLIAFSERPELGTYHTRLYSRALLGVARMSESPVMILATGQFFLSSFAKSQSGPKGLVALSLFEALLGGTDAPPLVIPLLEEAANALSYNLGYWTKRRITLLLYQQAADSPDERINEKAFELLSSVPSRSRSISLRALSRQYIAELGRTGRNLRVRQMALSASTKKAP